MRNCMVVHSLPPATACVRLLCLSLLALSCFVPTGASRGAASLFPPVGAPGVHSQQQGSLALQKSAPTRHPWTLVLLGTGTSLARAHAPAPAQVALLRAAGERAEEVVDPGSHGSDSNVTQTGAAAQVLAQEATAAQARAGLARAIEGSRGTAPNPAPAPGSAAAIEDGQRASDEVIVGKDDRTRVLATTTYPWRAVGSLIGDDGKNGWECTAALIAPSFLLTAAHCVYVPISGYLEHLKFCAGRDDANKPYGTVRGVRAAVPDAYRRLADADTSSSQYASRRPFDWAVIKLESAIGDHLGYFGRYRDYNDSNFIMNTAGYPFDKGNELWFSACDHQHMAPGEGPVFSYTCSTQSGNSGGPVWINNDGQRYFIGIHTGSDGLQMNYGTRYSSEVHAFVENAMSVM